MNNNDTTLLISGATCVLPEETRTASVLIQGNRIAALDPEIVPENAERVDASGLHLIPGVIDDQVHFREPGLTHKEDIHSGSRACAAGGVTSFLEMPNTNPTTTSIERLHEKLELASAKSIVNYGFYIGATPENLKELQNAKRTPGIKIFIGSSTGNLLVDEQAALEQIFAETDLPICAHCEDESVIYHNKIRHSPLRRIQQHSLVRDNLAAEVSTRRATALAIKHNHRFHVLHVSSASELPIIADHRNLITAEVCPHHLFFTVDDYDQLGSLVQMNPSLKYREDTVAIWDALQHGKIQMIASDHAPHTLEEKDQPYPNSPSGLPSVELILPLMLNCVSQGLCTIEQVVDWMSAAPAKVWDLVGKGRIAPGMDADMVLVDLNTKKKVVNEEQQTKSGWSPWHGTELTGWPVRTIVQGKTAFKNGSVVDSCRGAEIQFDHSRGGYWANR